MRLLVAEDDKGLRRVLARALHEQGHIVDAAADGEEALWLAGEHDYAVMVIDWRMPKLSGIDVVRQLRERSVTTKIMMLTARDAPSDRVAGLDAGADDYLTKPFELDELYARIRALLRRDRGSDEELCFGDLTYDLRKAEVSSDGQTVSVTATERAILEVLLRAAPNIATKKSIADHVWPNDLDGMGSNAIDVHIGRLRGKLARAHVSIVTVRGQGFRMLDESGPELGG
jgi:DNA-binding response OmpR family regulator